MIIAVDFDGTIVEHRYPKIGEEKPFAIETLKMLIRDRHQLILWVNRDYPEEDPRHNQHFSRKLKADIFIDDRNLGGLPDWGTIYEMITKRQSWEDKVHSLAQQSAQSTLPPPPKRKFWPF